MVFGVVDITHEPVEPLIASSSPFCHLSRAAADRPQQLEADKSSTINGFHDDLCRVFGKIPFSLEVLKLELVVVHPWCGDLSECFRLYAGEFAVDFDALAKEAEHIVPDRSDGLTGFHLALAVNVCKKGAYVLEAPLGLSRRHVYRELSAAKVVAQRSGRIQDKAAAGYQVPSCLHARLFADQLKVIDVDAENQLQFPVEEQALPAGKWLEVALQELFCEVIFPIFATHWVAV